MKDGVTNEFSEIYENMKALGMKIPAGRVTIEIQGAKTILENCFKYFLSFQNVEFIWQKEYDEVANWLENNNGLGLFLYGSCGRGKSFIVRYVIPAIVLKYQKKIINCYDSQQMNVDLDSVLNRHLIAIDEIGVEGISYDYGNKRDAFFEVMDSVEKYGKLILVSTNLSSDEIIKKYGERVFERIIATTKQIEFKGKSLRK
jgi:DNA replication protein DnaC